jgi:hypothetical protein
MTCYKDEVTGVRVKELSHLGRDRWLVLESVFAQSEIRIIYFKIRLHRTVNAGRQRLNRQHQCRYRKLNISRIDSQPNGSGEQRII